MAFVSNASNLAAGDGKSTSDVFRSDTSAGIVELCSATATGTMGNGWSNTPSINAEGRYLAFSSRASNLVAGDGNGASDVFRKRPLYEPPHLTSVSPGAGTAGSETTLTGTLFGNTRAGSYVAFGDIEAEAYSHWSDGEIKRAVPAEAYGRLMITVHTGQGVSNATAFTVYPQGETAVTSVL